MNSREVDFLRRLVVERPPHRQAGSSATSLALDQHVGRIDGRRIFYAESDFTRAANLLSANGIPLTVPYSYSRSQAPAGQSEKIGALPVAAGMVATRTLNMPQAWVVSGGFLVQPWDTAIRMDYEVLLVVENLDALIRLDEYRWLADHVRGRRTLALFRGTVGLLGTAAPAKLIHADARPTLAFFDFDPKGLAMAASLPRREALCLPPLTILEASADQERRRNLYSQSAWTSEAQLNRETDPQICSAWKLMTRLAMGLDQEHFPTG